jgi:hypothetical protein
MGFTSLEYNRTSQRTHGPFKLLPLSDRSGDRIPVGGEIFRTRPDRPWGPPSLLYKGYRVFPGGKAARAWCWSPTPFERRGQERVELYLYPPSGVSSLLRGTFTFYLYQASSQNFERPLSASSCLSVCPPVRMEQFGSHLHGLSWTSNISVFFENLSRKFKFH